MRSCSFIISAQLFEAWALCTFLVKIWSVRCIKMNAGLPRFLVNSYWMAQYISDIIVCLLGILLKQFDLWWTQIDIFICLKTWFRIMISISKFLFQQSFRRRFQIQRFLRCVTVLVDVRLPCNSWAFDYLSSFDINFLKWFSYIQYMLSYFAFLLAEYIFGDEGPAIFTNLFELLDLFGWNFVVFEWWKLFELFLDKFTTYGSLFIFLT